MDIQIIGTITKVLPKVEGTSSRTGNAWAKQEYVITEEGGNSRYPSSVCFQIFGQDKIASMNLQEGERVRVHLDISTNEWKDKVYNTITCWKVDRNSDNGNQVIYPEQAQQPSQPSQQPPQTQAQANVQSAPQQHAPQKQSQENDLPF